MTTYLGTVTLRLQFHVESTSTEAATEACTRLACERQGIRIEHLERVCATPILGDALGEVSAHRAWQISRAIMRGTSTQQERWRAGTLPEGELLDLARAELFRPFGLFVKRTPMGFAHIDHPRTAGIWRCLTVPRASGPVKDADTLVTWQTIPAPELTERESLTLRALNERAREVAQHPWLRDTRSTEVVGVGPREHRGTCQVCRRCAYERSALVTVYWAGRSLSREYVL